MCYNESLAIENFINFCDDMTIVTEANLFTTIKDKFKKFFLNIITWCNNKISKWKDTRLKRILINLLNKAKKSLVKCDRIKSDDDIVEIKNDVDECNEQIEEITEMVQEIELPNEKTDISDDDDTDMVDEDDVDIQVIEDPLLSIYNRLNNSVKTSLKYVFRTKNGDFTLNINEIGSAKRQQDAIIGLYGYIRNEINVDENGNQINGKHASIFDLMELVTILKIWMNASSEHGMQFINACIGEEFDYTIHSRTSLSNVTGTIVKEIMPGLEHPSGKICAKPLVHVKNTNY